MILVFKTSVVSREAIELLSKDLNSLIINKWNFDLEDCDRILRIDSKKKISKVIIKLLRKYGYYCEELI